MHKTYDYAVIGAGIMGLAVALSLKKQERDARIMVIDKEEDVAQHASGRNSGVLHAGFYYTADSLKARFTVTGNQRMKEFCRDKGIPVNACGKLVVAKNALELAGLFELERRGKENGVDVRILDEKEASAIEPNARTYKKALYARETASVDPILVCRAMRDDLRALGVDFQFQTKYLGKTKSAPIILHTTAGDLVAKHVVNCGGLYADKIAHDFGFSHRYTVIPFKGLYLKYAKNKTEIGMHIYPVPNLKNPFLGVHFTKTVAGDIKIGPTAIPAFWREDYGGRANFSIAELIGTCYYESRLFFSNAFGFRTLAFEEMQKYNKRHFIALASELVHHIDRDGFTSFAEPGIRAQLLDKKTLALVQDFVIEGDAHSTHVLNAVSPAFTSAFPFADFIVKTHILA